MLLQKTLDYWAWDFLQKHIFCCFMHLIHCPWFLNIHQSNCNVEERLLFFLCQAGIAMNFTRLFPPVIGLTDRIFALPNFSTMDLTGLTNQVTLFEKLLDVHNEIGVRHNPEQNKLLSVPTNTKMTICDFRATISLTLAQKWKTKIIWFAAERERKKTKTKKWVFKKNPKIGEKLFLSNLLFQRKIEKKKRKFEEIMKPLGSTQFLLSLSLLSQKEMFKFVEQGRSLEKRGKKEKYQKWLLTWIWWLGIFGCIFQVLHFVRNKIVFPTSFVVVFVVFLFHSNSLTPLRWFDWTKLVHFLKMNCFHE